MWNMISTDSKDEKVVAVKYVGTFEVEGEGTYKILTIILKEVRA